MEWLFKNCFRPVHNAINEMGDELSKFLTEDMTMEEPVIVTMEEAVTMEMEEPVTVKIENVRKRIVLETQTEN